MKYVARPQTYWTIDKGFVQYIRLEASEWYQVLHGQHYLRTAEESERLEREFQEKAGMRS